MWWRSIPGRHGRVKEWQWNDSCHRNLLSRETLTCETHLSRRNEQNAVNISVYLDRDQKGSIKGVEDVDADPSGLSDPVKEAGDSELVLLKILNHKKKLLVDWMRRGIFWRLLKTFALPLFLLLPVEALLFFLLPIRSTGDQEEEVQRSSVLFSSRIPSTGSRPDGRQKFRNFVFPSLLETGGNDVSQLSLLPSTELSIISLSTRFSLPFDWLTCNVHTESTTLTNMKNEDQCAAVSRASVEKRTKRVNERTRGTVSRDGKGIIYLISVREEKQGEKKRTHNSYTSIHRHSENPSHGQWSKRNGVFLLFSDWFAPLSSFHLLLISLPPEPKHVTFFWTESQVKEGSIGTLFLLLSFQFHWSQANRTGREKRWNSIELLLPLVDFLSLLNLLSNRTEEKRTRRQKAKEEKTLTRLHKRETYQTSNRQIVKTSEGKEEKREESKEKMVPVYDKKWP